MMTHSAGLTGPARVQDTSLRHVVERHILSEIRRGTLRPGDRLHESQLAKAVGVSLTPVREALFRLAQAGVIDHRPRQGFFLAELGPEQLEELVSLRAALEGLAASRASTRIRPAEIEELERVIEEGVRAARAGDPVRNAECNASFHSLIVQAARHSLLERAWQQIAPLRWLLMPAVAPAVDEAWIEDWEARHRGLLAAITSGDPERAEEAARAHLHQRSHAAPAPGARHRGSRAWER
jgi:DNA-binding GntR family transcriptional regulator